MASHQALAAIGAAIRGLLSERYPRDEFDGLDVELIQYRDIEKGLTGEGFGILLWRIAINTQRRARGPRTDVFGNRFRPSLPVDLSFLVIPYSATPEKHLRMLGWVMRALEDAGTLTATQLNHYLAESDVFAPDESVELVCDPLSVSDHLSMWDRMRKHPPIGAYYLVRMALLDSTQAIEAYPAVVEREFQAGAMADE
ncbi:MAG TPA: DUF4255 domain-containing protein [Novosphingobium sp.]|nr:DUF4255 domain-containing protein [Novosphingobium sp.]